MNISDITPERWKAAPDITINRKNEVIYGKVMEDSPTKRIIAIREGATYRLLKLNKVSDKAV